MGRPVVRLAAVAGLLASALLPAVPATAGTSPPGASSCPVFPSDNVWNADISHLPVDPHSSQWLASMNSSTTNLHPDLGSSGDPSAPYGIPYTVVTNAHPKVSVSFQYASESDPGPYPFGADTPIEGGQNASGDRHAIMVDSSTCTLYELYDAQYSAGGSTAGSGAIWNLQSDALRPAGWTSADAAGLPIFPGLLRPDEVAAGVVSHAIRFTADETDTSYIWPARHEAGARSDPSLPPMGARFRLKASFNISGYAADTQAVLRAMQHYGLILADNGSNWYFQGSASNSWDPTMIAQLKTIPASAFEAVDESSLMVNANSGAVAASSSGGGSSSGGSGSGGSSGGGGAGGTGPVGRLALSRVAGSSRDLTSVAASEAEFPSPGTARTVVLASDTDFADALAGTPLAATTGGPLLLTVPSGLSLAVSVEIARVMKPGGTVYVLGGPLAVAANVDDQLRSLGYVPQRLAGADRFQTAVAIAGALGNPSTVFEATGLDFPDGLSAGAAASRAHGVVLLTNGSAPAAATVDYLKAHPGQDYAIGGPAALADPAATPLAGADRYATATSVAQRFFASPTVVGFASGAVFPDALTGGANIAARGGPLLLVPPTGALPPSLSSYLGANPTIRSGVIYGGTFVVGPAVATELSSA